MSIFAPGPAREAPIDRTMLIYAATIAIAAIVILRRPGAAAGILFCTYGLEQWAQSQSAWFFMHGTLTNALTAMLVVLAVLVRFQRGQPLLRDMPREYWLVFTLTSLMVASTAWSISPADTLGNFKSEGLYFIVYALIMPMIVSDRRDARDACYALLTMGTAFVFLLLLTSRWDSRSIVFASGSSFALYGSDRGNPLAIGTFGGYVSLIALLMNFGGVARIWQIVRYAVVLAGFAISVKSGSRGETAAILLTSFVLLPYSRRVRNLGSFIGFAVSILICAIVGTYVFDVYSAAGRFDFNSGVAEIRASRIGMAQVLLGEWLTAGPFRWILGFGSSASFAIPGLNYYPHVVPAEVLGELGVVGFSLLLTIWFFAYRNVREMWPLVRDDPQARGVIACIAAIFLFKWVVGWKEGSFVSSHELLGASVVLGRLAFSTRQEAAAEAEIDAAGYAMTDEERFLEDESYLDELYDPAPAGRV